MTTHDTPAPRCVCGDPIEWQNHPDGSGWIHSPGSDTRCLDAQPATTPAPMDPALRDRIADDHPRDRLCAAFIRLIREYPDRSVIAPGVLADAVLAELAPELTRAHQAVNAENALRDEKRHYDSAWREIVRLRAQLVRIQQMTDAWERELPETIRTATVVDALRIAIALTGPAEDTP